jgi:hypothetical protein
MRFVRRVLATGAVVALLCPPVAASADSVTRADAVGDVARSPVGSTASSPAPGRADGDIVSTRVTHGAHRIWIGLRLRDLTTTTNGNFHRFWILSDRRFRAVEIDAFPGHWAGHAVMTTRNGQVVGCAVSHRIDYVEHRVVLSIPRSCLGHRPAWVRVAARSTVAGTTYAYTDDARATGLGRLVVYGPRVRR